MTAGANPRPDFVVRLPTAWVNQSPYPYIWFDRLTVATGVRDLMRPGNRLEALKGRREGQWSIRINDQWRICFEWPEGSPGPTRVEIVDYH